MSKLDAILISNVQYQSTRELIEDYFKLSKNLNVDHCTVEGFRFSTLDQFNFTFDCKVGFHHFGKGQDYIKFLIEKIKSLSKQNIHFNVLGDLYGLNDSILLSPAIGHASCKIVIPFEDRPQNTKRFLNRYANAIKQIGKLHTKDFDQWLDDFQYHCIENFTNETPFELSINKIFSKVKTGFVFNPVCSQLGRHKIVRSIDITHDDLDRLILLYEQLLKTQRGEPDIHLHYFGSSETDERFLFEKTYDVKNITHEKAIEVLKQMQNLNLSDLFVLMDFHKENNLQSLLVQFRLTKTDGFELRINPFFMHPDDQFELAFSKATQMDWIKIA